MLACSQFNTASAQGCPVNIDFESGTFNGWRCYVGHVASVNGQNVISIDPTGGPVNNQHTMMSSYPGDGMDPYGDFPVNCPNGSGHSIKLGNTNGGNEAEGVSYEFTIPADKDVYSLIYHYAVVFQDPNHLESEQPRMEVEITNVTDNVRIDCSSFAFHPYGSPLPGFQLSPNPGTNTPVWFKDWSAVSINLDNKAGKTIRLFFKTADCTFRRHFGYAYVDVNSECSGEFTGAAYCPDDTAVNVIAPYGYQGYKWFNSSLTSVIGNGQKLTLSPPPPPGTRIAVELIPYNGYGCLDTLYAKLIDTLTVTAHAGEDTRSCNHEAVPIGIPPRPGLSYRWSPTAGLSNPNISNPLASPSVTTNYVLTASSSGGGCASTDTVLVKAEIIDDSIRVVGKQAYCITDNDSAILVVQPTYNIQWFKDNLPIINSNTPRYHVQQSGTYYAFLSSQAGCSANTIRKTVVIDAPRPGISYPVRFSLINTPLTLHARNFGKTAQWSPGNNLSDASSFSPSFTAAADQLYKVAITTASGCVTTDTQFVKMVSHVDIVVPNAFTPNKDGKNDVLRPMLRGITDMHYFRVFNRWGQLLFETHKEFEGWDGLINGSNQPTQTVVWVVEGVGADDKVYKKTGTSVLVRE
ncbi:MAG TPA: T9SS type B sorting domain-containing protein [Chitinophagaceae bacterium]|nr:T9SS type B sorting domain-containing protein [Chitinophagaceae bacterium]